MDYSNSSTQLINIKYKMVYICVTIRPMNSKTQAQEVTEYIHQLEELQHQSQLIRREVQQHIKFSHLQDRIGAVQQQLQFIRHHVLPKTAKEKAKYFKHNKLALKLIDKHLAEIEDISSETRLKELQEEDERWAVIEELREETLHNIEHAEAALQEAEVTHEDPAKETKDILLYEAEIIELADKTELILKEIELHGHFGEPIFELIHNLHNELQFIKLHAYSRQFGHEVAHPPTLLGHHFEAINDISGHLFHLHNHWGHMLEQLHHESHEEVELKQLHEEIQHTKEQFEEKLEELEEEKIHYMQHPGAHIIPVKFNNK